MVFRAVDIIGSESIGAKACTLAAIKQAGYNVPDFIVLAPDELGKVFAKPVIDNEQLEQLRAKIVELLPNTRFAVRSAAIDEDGSTISNAGQFHTVLDVAVEDLPGAVLDVCTQAAAKLDSSEKFSIIIQEFIQPDKAGVIFSRNPLGGQEMVVEFVSGVGEEAVGGKSVERIVFLPFQAINYQSALSCVEELTTVASQLELKFGYPQDIEWALKDEQLYILQSRPITSLSEDQWQGLQYLGYQFKDKKEYLYEQNTLAETFSQPKPLAYSILEKLYQNRGPIEQAYQQIGVKYQATAQLQQFGNEVYVDRQAETQSLFPAMGYFKYCSAAPKIERLAGLLTTFKNSFALGRLSLSRFEMTQQLVTTLLKKELVATDSLAERWNSLLQAYPTIFLINLQAQKSLVKLERLLTKNSIVLGGLLSDSFQPWGDSKSEPDTINFEIAGLQGNSISLDDVSPFVINTQPAEHKTNHELSNWWQSLPQWKQHGLLPHIKSARRHAVLREQARWASVKLISHLRQAVETKGQSIIPDNHELIFFSTIAELLCDELDLQKLKERQQRYQKNKNLKFPQRIASFFPETTSNKNTNQGLSPGTAEGILVTAEMIESIVGPKILHTKVLSPDLSKYLAQVVGITTEQGGLLSHMAIVAREAKIPVVQTKMKLELEKNTKINGSTGTIVTVNR